MEHASPLIQFEAMTFSHAQNEPIFKELNFTFYSDMKAGLIGKNGSGKTTLLHLIMGLIKPQSGTITIFNESRLLEKDFFDVRKKIGFVFQDPNDQLFCPSVAEDIAFGPINHGISQEIITNKTKEVLKLIGLSGFEERMTHTLSDGQKKLISIATVLVMEPQLLILDEPTTCLDEDSTQRIEAILHQLTIPYLIVSHDHDFLDRVVTTKIFLKNGLLETLHT